MLKQLKNLTEKQKKTAAMIIVLVMALVVLLTSYKLGQQSAIAPTAPTSQQAYGGTPVTACEETVAFKVRPSATATPFPSPILSTPTPSPIAATPTPGPSATPGAVTATIGADAFLRQQYPTENKGTSSSIRVQARNTSISGSSKEDGLLRFNVSGTGGRQIKSAYLKLYVKEGSVNGGSAYTVGNTWTETGVNWNNAPVSDALTLSFGIGSVSTNQWKQIDVTKAVKGDGAVTFRITSTNTDTAIYAARENGTATRPQLIVTTY